VITPSLALIYHACTSTHQSPQSPQPTKFEVPSFHRLSTQG